MIAHFNVISIQIILPELHNRDTIPVRGIVAIKTRTGQIPTHLELALINATIKRHQPPIVSHAHTHFAIPIRLNGVLPIMRVQLQYFVYKLKELNMK